MEGNLKTFKLEGNFNFHEIISTKKKREFKKFHLFCELGKLNSFTRFATYIDFLMIFILLFKCKENDENQLKLQVLNNSLQDVILILYVFPLCSRKTMEV